MRLILSQLDLDPDAGVANLGAVRDEVRDSSEVAAEDVLLLPELVGGESHPADYEASVRELAAALGCHVVGGSHYPAGGAARVNRGLVAGPDGSVRCHYEKLHPYGVERSACVEAGTAPGWFECAGRQVLVLLCADFWFSRVFHDLPLEPDVVLVSSFSVSRKPDPHQPRSLWRHMAVARAYEFGAFVGISDWAHPIEHAGTVSSGVAGLARPNPPLREPYFQPVSRAGTEAFELDFERLEELRRDRGATGFLQSV